MALAYFLTPFAFPQSSFIFLSVVSAPVAMLFFVAFCAPRPTYSFFAVVTQLSRVARICRSHWLFGHFGLYWMLCERYWPRPQIIERLEQLALAEVAALTGELANPEDLRFHSFGVEL